MNYRDELLEWEPFCGETYLLSKTAGSPIICTRNMHGEDIPHLNLETGFEWWLKMGNPRLAGGESETGGSIPARAASTQAGSCLLYLALLCVTLLRSIPLR